MRSKLAQDIRALIKGKDIAQEGLAAAEAMARAENKRREVGRYVAENRAFRF